MDLIIKLTIFLLLVLPLNLYGQTLLEIGSFNVTDNKATIRLPIVPQEKYIWYHPNSPVSAAEYICFIEVEKFNFGFSLYNFNGSTEKVGSIQELLSKGQSDIWKQDGNSYDFVPKHKVKISYLESSSSLLLEISNPNTIKLLFSEKPDKAIYSIQGFKSRVPEGKLKIRYK